MRIWHIEISVFCPAWDVDPGRLAMRRVQLQKLIVSKHELHVGSSVTEVTIAQFWQLRSKTMLTDAVARPVPDHFVHHRPSLQICFESSEACTPTSSEGLASSLEFQTFLWPWSTIPLNIRKHTCHEHAHHISDDGPNFVVGVRLEHFLFPEQKE